MKKRFFNFLLWSTYWQLIARQKVSDARSDLMQTGFGRVCVAIILILALAAVGYMIYTECVDQYYNYQIIHNHSRLPLNVVDSI